MYSDLPLSVVFVGVGRADFRPMHQLLQECSVGCRLTSIFLELREHQGDHASLAKTVLQFVSTQVGSFLDSHARNNKF